MGGFKFYWKHGVIADRPDSRSSDELATVRTYLDVQALRMAGRMTYQVSAEPDLERVSIPPLLVQPLVENAVLHGIEPSASGGRVTVREETLEGGVSAELWIPATAREAVAG